MVFPLRKIIDFAMIHPDEVDLAYKQFFGMLPFSELKSEWEELFLEWLIFDFKTLKRTSFLAEYVLKNPDKLDNKALDQFKQIVETQFYSQFEIQKIKRGQLITVEDLFTAETYTIYEKKGSERLSERGILPGRIAKVDEKWYLVGANSVYFPITYTERAKRNIREIKIKNFSPKDTIELLMSQEQSSPPTISMPTAEELQEKRKSLKEEYGKVAKKFGAALLVNELIEEIYKEERVNVLDFWKSLEKKGLKFEVLVENTELLQDIWNYFPHKCLKDLSPIEVFTKFSKKGAK